MSKERVNPMDYVFMPPRATAEAMETYTEIRNNPSPFDFGVPIIDGRVNPLMGGELASLIARPGMGKTSLMVYLAKRWAGLISRDDEVVVYATWETLVEEFLGVFTSDTSRQTLEMIGRGTADMGAIRASLLSVLGVNVCIFGRSRKTSNRGIAPPTLLDLHEALSRLWEEYGVKPKALFIDYLQRIPGRDYSTAMDDRSTKVSENMEIAKDIALRHGCSTYIGVQARREVDEYGGVKMPSMSDGQWSSVVEQTSDKVFGGTMPGKYLPSGTKVVLNGFQYSIGPSTLILNLLKQRWGPASKDDVFIIDFDVSRLHLSTHVTLGEVVEDEERSFDGIL